MADLKEIMDVMGIKAAEVQKIIETFNQSLKSYAAKFSRVDDIPCVINEFDEEWKPY